jgi:hypothetical protein
LDQPALEPLEGEPPTVPAPDMAREAMVVFRDGTWRLCRVAGWWQDSNGRWWHLLCWGVNGTVYEGWYRHDDPRSVTSLLA